MPIKITVRRGDAAIVLDGHPHELAGSFVARAARAHGLPVPPVHSFVLVPGPVALDEGRWIAGKVTLAEAVRRYGEPFELGLVVVEPGGAIDVRAA